MTGTLRKWLRLARDGLRPRPAGAPPLPWREAERVGVGGYPQAPTKEGCALSGLSRQTEACLVPRGSEGGKGWCAKAPYKEGSALSALSCRTGACPVPSGKRRG